MLTLFHPEVQALNELLTTALGARRPTSGRNDGHALDEQVIGANDDVAGYAGEVVEWLYSGSGLRLCQSGESTHHTVR